MPHTQEQNLIAYKKLTIPVREFLMSPEKTDEVFQIARINGLSDEQKNKLVDAISELILGFITPEECEKKIIELGLINDKIENIKKYVREKIVEKIKVLKTLPNVQSSDENKEIGGVFVDEKTISDAVSDISKKYQITEEQTSGIEREINRVLSGEAKLSAFRSNLVNFCKVTYDQALKIAYDTNEKVFSNVINRLKEMESNVLTGETKEETVEEKNIVEQFVPKKPETHEVLKKQAGVITPDHMIPDHITMEITDGPHLHSQNLMPQSFSGVGFQEETKQKTFKAVPPPQNIPLGTSGTSIDQKLSQIVRSSNTGATTPKGGGGYKGNDPYRESIR